MTLLTNWTDGFDYQNLPPTWQPGCFPAHSLVRTAAGMTPIVSIKPGDLVTSFDARSGNICNRKVIRLKSHQPRRLYQIELENDEMIETTASHSFLSGRGWKTTRRLRLGDAVHTVDGLVPVRKVTKTSCCAPVYNLITECEHTFVVHGCVVHNFTHLRRARVFAHRLLRLVREARRFGSVPNVRERARKALAVLSVLALSAGSASANCGPSTNCADHLRHAERQNGSYETAQPSLQSNDGHGIGEVISGFIIGVIACSLFESCRDAVLKK